MKIFYSLVLLLSFVTLSGVLNTNYYIKVFVFEFLLIIICLFLVIRKPKISNNTILVTWADITIFIFLSVYSYYCIGSSNVIDHYLPIVYILFYFSFRFSYRDNLVKILTMLSPFVISIHLIICTLQYISVLPNYNSYFKVASSFGNLDMLSSYLAMLLPFCYLGNKWIRFRLSITILTVCLFLILQSRTAIVAFIITLLIYLISKQILSKKMIVLICLSIVLSIVLLVYWHPKSVFGRIYIWIVSFNMLIDKPLGWGLYSFEKYYPEFQSQFTIENQDLVSILNYDVVHSPYNEFLNIGVTFGILGLLLYVALVIYILISAYKIKSSLLFPLLTYQIISLSYFSFKIIPLTVLYLLCSAIVISTSKTGSFHLFLSIKLERIILLCVGVIVIFHFSLSLYSYRNWQKAIEQSSTPQTYMDAHQSFQKSYFFLKTNGRFLISYAELQYKLGNKQKAFILMHQAECYFSDIVFLHNLAMIYEEEGNIETAEDKFILAANMSPNNIKILIAHIQFLQRIGEKDKAYKLKKILSDKEKKMNSVR